MTTASDPATAARHLELRGPIAMILSFILALVGQSVVVGWWIGDLLGRIDAVVLETAKQDERIRNVEASDNAQAVAFATTNAQLGAMRESMAEMKAAQAETNRLLQEFIRQGARP